MAHGSEAEMRDRLKRPYLDNLPGKNQTQTHYTRFMKSPASRLVTQFEKSAQHLNRLRDWTKASHYSALLEV